jgi:hypothetical protein
MEVCVFARFDMGCMCIVIPLKRIGEVVYIHSSRIIN